MAGRRALFLCITTTVLLLLESRAFPLVEETPIVAQTNGTLDSNSVVLGVNPMSDNSSLTTAAQLDAHDDSSDEHIPINLNSPQPVPNSDDDLSSDLRNILPDEQVQQDDDPDPLSRSDGLLPNDFLSSATPLAPHKVFYAKPSFSKVSKMNTIDNELNVIREDSKDKYHIKNKKYKDKKYKTKSNIPTKNKNDLKVEASVDKEYGYNGEGEKTYDEMKALDEIRNTKKNVVKKDEDQKATQESEPEVMDTNSKGLPAPPSGTSTFPKPISTVLVPPTQEYQTHPSEEQKEEVSHEGVKDKGKTVVEEKNSNYEKITDNENILTNGETLVNGSESEVSDGEGKLDNDKKISVDSFLSLNRELTPPVHEHRSSSNLNDDQDKMIPTDRLSSLNRELTSPVREHEISSSLEERVVDEVASIVKEFIPLSHSINQTKSIVQVVVQTEDLDNDSPNPDVGVADPQAEFIQLEPHTSNDDEKYTKAESSQADSITQVNGITLSNHENIKLEENSPSLLETEDNETKYWDQSKSEAPSNNEEIISKLENLPTSSQEESDQNNPKGLVDPDMLQIIPASNLGIQVSSELTVIKDTTEKKQENVRKLSNVEPNTPTRSYIQQFLVPPPLQLNPPEPVRHLLPPHKDYNPKNGQEQMTDTPHLSRYLVPPVNEFEGHDLDINPLLKEMPSLNIQLTPPLHEYQPSDDGEANSSSEEFEFEFPFDVGELPSESVPFKEFGSVYPVDSDELQGESFIKPSRHLTPPIYNFAPNTYEDVPFPGETILNPREHLTPPLYSFTHVGDVDGQRGQSPSTYLTPPLPDNPVPEEPGAQVYVEYDPLPDRYIIPSQWNFGPPHPLVDSMRTSPIQDATLSFAEPVDALNENIPIPVEKLTPPLSDYTFFEQVEPISYSDPQFLGYNIEEDPVKHDIVSLLEEDPTLSNYFVESNANLTRRRGPLLQPDVQLEHLEEFSPIVDEVYEEEASPYLKTPSSAFEFQPQPMSVPSPYENFAKYSDDFYSLPRDEYSSNEPMRYPWQANEEGQAPQVSYNFDRNLFSIDEHPIASRLQEHVSDSETFDVDDRPEEFFSPINDHFISPELDFFLPYINEDDNVMGDEEEWDLEPEEVPDIVSTLGLPFHEFESHSRKKRDNAFQNDFTGRNVGLLLGQESVPVPNTKLIPPTNEFSGKVLIPTTSHQTYLNKKDKTAIKGATESLEVSEPILYLVPPQAEFSSEIKDSGLEDLRDIESSAELENGFKETLNVPEITRTLIPPKYDFPVDDHVIDLERFLYQADSDPRIEAYSNINDEMFIQSDAESHQVPEPILYLVPPQAEFSNIPEITRTLIPPKYDFSVDDHRIDLERFEYQANSNPQIPTDLMPLESNFSPIVYDGTKSELKHTEKELKKKNYKYEQYLRDFYGKNSLKKDFLVPQEGDAGELDRQYKELITSTSKKLIQSDKLLHGIPNVKSEYLTKTNTKEKKISVEKGEENFEKKNPVLSLSSKNENHTKGMLEYLENALDYIKLGQWDALLQTERFKNLSALIDSIKDLPYIEDSQRKTEPQSEAEKASDEESGTFPDSMNLKRNRREVLRYLEELFQEAAIERGSQEDLAVQEPSQGDTSPVYPSKFFPGSILQRPESSKSSLSQVGMSDYLQDTSNLSSNQEDTEMVSPPEDTHHHQQDQDHNPDSGLDQRPLENLNMKAGLMNYLVDLYAKGRLEQETGDSDSKTLSIFPLISFLIMLYSVSLDMKDSRRADILKDALSGFLQEKEGSGNFQNSVKTAEDLVEKILPVLARNDHSWMSENQVK